MKRLPPVPGEWIDRQRPLAFSFEGRSFTGFAGDVISSALAASGVRVVGRSFKYHRPRGWLSFANADVNALLQAGERLNLRADVAPLEAGLELSAVNTVGGLARDRARFLNALARFLPVGFYYKAFHSKRWFPYWERVFRRASGLGVVDANTQRVRTAKRYDFCDVLVIGGGPAGLRAALTAAERGSQVALVDENARLGGSGLFNLGGSTAQREQVGQFVERALSHPRIRSYTSTFAAGYYADHWVPLVEPTRITKMRARAVIFATGAIEQPAVFRNNDLPGVMLASAAQRMLYRYAVAPGSRAVVLAANEDAYRAARDLIAHGVAVEAIVDLRSEAGSLSAKDASLDAKAGSLSAEAGSLNTLVFPGHGIYEAVATRSLLSGVRIAPLRSDGALDSTQCREIPCDLLLMSTGWAPALNLLRQSGASLSFNDALSQFVPAALPEGIFACGRVNGVYDLSDRYADGQRAGSAAAQVARALKDSAGQRAGLKASQAAGISQTNAREQSAKAAQQADATRHETSGVHGDGSDESSDMSAGRAARSSATAEGTELRRGQPSHPFPIFAHPRGKNFVDFDEDLQLQDFHNAAQEGFDNIELLKRFSTFGMGPSQGKHSNVNASRVLAKIRGLSVGEISTPTSRPLYHPVPMSHLAGRAFSVERRTPLHSRHAQLNATFMTAGAWQRPEYYFVDGLSREQAIHAEARAVREAVGLIDVGTLGKIEARGRDAGALLDRAYTGRFSNMKTGTTRYGLMLDDAGVITDDGVIARLAEDHYYFTTTTSGSATVYRELQRLNLISALQATLINLTGHLGAINLAGPRAREVLSAVSDLDLSNTAFPYLAVRVGTVAGIPARLMRVGFVGELGYEIHAPAYSMPIIWDALMEAGATYGIRPFGVEAQRLLRLEKGHIIIGQDTDGLTNPMEIGATWALALNKPFFVGQRSLQVLAKRPLRQQLVGFHLTDPNGPRPQESHLVIANGDIAGRITSISWSPTLQAVIGLAFVDPSLSTPGTNIQFRLTDGSLITAKVAKPPFYDPENSRQHTQSDSRSTAVSTNERRATSPVLLRGTGGQSVALSDLSLLPRMGLKGAGAAEWLRARGVAVPQERNQWEAYRGGIVGRLGATEFLLEAAAGDDWVSELEREAVGAVNAVPVLRQDASLLLSGPRVHELLEQTCSFDFSSLQSSPHELVMTQMIGVSVIVIALSLSPTPAYRLWCDPSFALYLFHTLESIAAEINGAARDWHQLIDLPTSHALTPQVTEQAP